MATVTDLYRNLFGKVAIKDGTVIDMAEHGRAGGVSTGQGYKFTKNADETIKVDEASSTVIYQGFAIFGSLTSEAVWQIKKIEESGTVTTVTYADGNDDYDNIWDNRAALSYS